MAKTKLRQMVLVKNSMNLFSLDIAISFCFVLSDYSLILYIRFI